MVAFLFVAGALAGVVADTGTRPHIVHGPYHGFARGKDLLDVFQRKHTLVYPVEVDDVGLLELRQSGDVRAGIGDIDGKQVVFLEVVGFPDDDAFPHELPYQAPALLEGHYADLVGLLVAHQHFCLDAVVLEGFHESACGDGCTAYTFGCIDNKYSHVAECFGKSTAFTALYPQIRGFFSQ